MLGNRSLLDDPILGVVLLFGDEYDLSIRQAGEPTVIGIAAVNHDDRSGLKPELAGHRDVTNRAIADDRIFRQIAIMVQQQMDLNGAFGSSEPGPIEQGQAQVNHRGIEAYQLVLEPEFLPALGMVVQRAPAAVV